MSSNGKSSAKSSELVPQPHGGALLPGAGGGKQPGAGRPPSAIREYCRGSFAQRIPVLEAIADGQPLDQTTVDEEGAVVTRKVSARLTDRVKAIDVLAKYGGVDKLALTADEQPEEKMTPERVTQMWESLQRVKTMQQLEKMLIGAAREQAG